MFRKDMTEYIKASMESLLLNSDYIDTVIVAYNNAIFPFDAKGFREMMPNKVNLVFVEDKTTTNFRSFELGVRKFLELKNTKTLTFLDGDDSLLSNGLKIRLESPNPGVQLSRLENIQYSFGEKGWYEVGRTRSNYRPTDRLSILYRNSAFSSGLTVTKRFVDNYLIPALNLLKDQTFDMVYEDWLTWALGMMLELDSFVFTPTGIYRFFGFARKESIPQVAEIREGLSRLLTPQAIMFVLSHLDKADLVKKPLTAIVDISYSSFAVKY